MTIKKLLEVAEKLQYFNETAALIIPSAALLEDIDFTQVDFDLFKKQKVDHCDRYLDELRNFALNNYLHSSIIEGIEDIKVRVIDRTFRIHNDFELFLNSNAGVESEAKIMLAPFDWFTLFEGDNQHIVTDLLYLDHFFADGLISLIEELKGVKPSINVYPELTPAELKATSHKMVLLHELGIVDFLKNRYYNQGNKDHKGGDEHLSELLAVITGNQQTTIRKGILDYKQAGKKGNVFTKSAIYAVNEVLFKVKIKPIEHK